MGAFHSVFHLSIISFLASSFVVKADNRPFIYANQSTDGGYGLKSWTHVEPAQYYFNWTRFVGEDGTSSNKCNWGSAGESPINIVEPILDRCNGTLPFDRHRWQSDHGTCHWTDLQWEIKPWGLFMQFPMPESGNFESTPCRKPSINSSGGLVDRFYATHITIKAKSEHYLLGKQYDAEINIAHTRYYEKNMPFEDPNNTTVFTASILVNANETNGDNPILEPYLREWMRTYDEVSGVCSAAFPLVPGTGSRKLQDDGITSAFMNGTFAFFPEFDLYQLLTTPWFYAYRGGLTMPSCQKRVFWRVLEQPLEISTRQRELINQMISNARDPMTCQLLTSGTPRQDGSGYVDVNRPLQPYSDTTNKLMHCDKLDFVSSKFFHTPRGNTGWSLLEANNLTIPETYWWRTYDDYNVTSVNGPGNISALVEGERNATIYLEQLWYNLSIAPRGGGAGGNKNGNGKHR